MTYLEVLQARLAAEGWKPDPEALHPRELLRATHGADTVVFLQAATPQEVQQDVARQRPGTNLVYLFTEPLPPGLETAIRQASTRRVMAGFLDLQQGQGWVRPGPGQSAVRALLRPGQVPPEQRRTEELLDVLAGTQPRGTYALVALCLAMFVWAQASGGTESIPVLLRFGANYRPLTEAGEWWRLVGAMFMHIGPMHLAMNMYSLWVVGPILERFMGTLRYLAMYAVAGIGGSLASVLLGSGEVSAGASGAVFGVFGATAFLGWRWRDAIPESLRKQLLGGMLPTILFNLFIGSTVAGIDNLAHVGGLLSGVLFTALVPPRITLPRLPAVAVPLIGALALAPFAAEAYVAWRAATTSPYVSPASVTWTIPGSDLTFRHSPVFREQTEDGEVWLSAPGMNLSAHVLPPAGLPALRAGRAPEAVGEWQVAPVKSGYLATGTVGAEAVAIVVQSRPEDAAVARRVLLATIATVR